MNGLALALLAAALLTALLDWVAVARSARRLEYVLKPVTVALLAACAATLNPVSPPQRSWFVLALLLGMAGDIYLMLPRDLFLPGLVAFLLGHLAYIAGFASTGVSPLRALAMAMLIALPVAVLLPRILGGLRRAGRSRLVPAVVVYVVVIAAMVAAAFAGSTPFAVFPALVFFCSDALIAFNRFVSPRPWMPVAIMITYHLAQAGLVLILVRA